MPESLNKVEACNFINKETLARAVTLLRKMFSSEFCEISKNTLFLQKTSGGCSGNFTLTLNSKP